MDGIALVIPGIGTLYNCQQRMFIYCALNAYVAYDREGAALTAANPNIITAGHVQCINAMGARSKPDLWEPFMPGTALLTLLPAEPDPSSSLLTMTDDQWAAVMPNLSTVLNEITTDANGIGLAGATKMLHLHRPNLVPICDARLVELFPTPATDVVGQTIDLMQAFRECAAANLLALAELQTALAAMEISGGPIELSTLRILEAICWMQATPAYQNLWALLVWDELV